MRGLGGLILAAVLMAGMAAAQTTAQTPSLLSVTGEATVTAAPDLATVTLGVTTTDALAGAAMKANSAALATVMERLQAAGIADRDLQTSNLQLNPNWTNPENGGMATISGYTASNMLSVRVRDLAILGAVLDAAITDGANTLNGISFGQADPRPIQDAARKAAVADAIARAKLLTDAAGVKLGRVLNISENAGYGAPMQMLAAADMAKSVPVAAGEIGVTASVTMVFELVN
jgi:uncharacterized protein YggE